jgi:hypothetical protein
MNACLGLRVLRRPVFLATLAVMGCADREPSAVAGDLSSTGAVDDDCEAIEDADECEAEGCAWAEGRENSASDGCVDPPACGEIEGADDCETLACDWVAQAEYCAPMSACSSYADMELCQAHGCTWFFRPSGAAEPDGPLGDCESPRDATSG